MQTFSTPAPVLAVLDVPAGRIQIIAADRADTTVEILPSDAAKSRDVKAAEGFQVAYGEGVLRIEAPKAANRILGASGSVEVTVRVPAGSRIEAKAASADFRGVGRLGDVAFEGARSTVKLDETAAARLTLQSGGVEVGRLGGPAEITTQDGDLTIKEALDGAVNLRTERGNITIGAAREASATLDAATSYGRVQNALRNTVGAGAALTIKATTAYGDIVAHSN